jgi:predicted acyltransferase
MIAGAVTFLTNPRGLLTTPLWSVCSPLSASALLFARFFGISTSQHQLAVKGATIEKKLEFLMKKGLTAKEAAKAFQRVNITSLGVFHLSALCSLFAALCSVHSALCSLVSALCSMRYVVMLSLLCKLVQAILVKHLDNALVTPS